MSCRWCSIWAEMRMSPSRGSPCPSWFYRRFAALLWPKAECAFRPGCARLVGIRIGCVPHLRFVLRCFRRRFSTRLCAFDDMRIGCFFTRVSSFCPRQLGRMPLSNGVICPVDPPIGCFLLDHVALCDAPLTPSVL